MSPRSRRLLQGAGAAALVLTLLAVLFPAGALPGVLAAFLCAVQASGGAMLLLLIHRLTGGAWGEAARPVLAPAAVAMPLAALLLLPVLAGLGHVYPWAADPGAVRHEDVARLLLNEPSFVLRSLLVLTLWSLLAHAAAADRLSKAGAALALAAFGATVSLSGVDWVLSLDPRFKSTAFPMSLAVAALLAGAAMARFARCEDGETAADLSKLTAAFALGLLYLDLMQFLVAYDGNLPDKAAWYLRRSGAPWAATLALAFCCAGLLPFLAVLRAPWRRSETLGRIVGTSVLFGLVLRTAWWTLPEAPAGLASTASLLLALAAFAAAGFALRDRLRPHAVRGARHGT